MNKTFNTEKMYGYTFNYLALPNSNFFKLEFVSKIGSNIERVLEQKDGRNLYGIVHFIEHLGFRATRDYSSDELLKALHREGSYNASTDHERINYWVKTSNERKELATKLVANIVFNDLKTIPQEEFDLEKNVVMNEARLYKDDEHTMFHFNTPNTVCGLHEEDNIIGDADTIEKFTLEQVVEVKEMLMRHGEKIVNITYDPAQNSQTDIREMVHTVFAGFPVLGYTEKDLKRPAPQIGQDFNMDNDSDRYLVNVLFDFTSLNNVVRGRGNFYLGNFADTSLNNIIREKHGLTYNVAMGNTLIWGDMYTVFSTDVTPGTEDQLMTLFEQSIAESVDNFTPTVFAEMSETLDLKRTMREMNLQSFDVVFWNEMWGDGVDPLAGTDLEAGLAKERDAATYESVLAYLTDFKAAVIAKNWCKVTNKT